ncbi:MAG: OmpA family protein [Bacteroidetes bacterium]|nr:OmpA family protein [Bacteroidota bacterium]MBS1925282.1 OmpA family protein [Bacteroidota bacterium]MCC6692504.1 OmpA family protein [Chitinophagaceae bacterium]HMU23832.1 OmpA family protein [Ferruginibacter sp.]
MNTASRKIVIGFFFLQLTVMQGFAQWYNPDKVNKKAQQLNEEAYEAAQEGNYTGAITLLDKALQADPKFLDAILSKAGIYGNLKNYPLSVKEYENAFKLDAQYSDVYLLPYSISLAGTGNFSKALEAVNKFLQNPTLNAQSKKAGNFRKSTYKFALDYAVLHPEAAAAPAPQNLGDSINTIHLEYFPSLTIDGKSMVFTRRINSDEDFYVSNFINGSWSKARPIEGRVNTNLNEGAQNISQDGEWLVFTGCNYPEGLGSCDLYISYKTKSGKWTEPQNLPGVINSEFWESSPCLSPDKRDLYFSSNRTGGFGGKDIWVSHQNANGRWTEPVNLGPVINTSSDEGCPFIHADNQTLYFNSNGHAGYGATDLFLSRKKDDFNWSTPQNLGYPINTIDDEGSLIVASNGKTAYYASDGADTKGGLDIYSYQLPDSSRAAKTLWVNGKVFDKKTGEGLPSLVELFEVNSSRMVSRLQTDENGHYLITLPVGKDYVLNVNRKNYLFYSDHFSLPSNQVDTSFYVDIPLQPIETGASIVLKNIFFDSKKWELKPGSQTELNKVVQLLNDNPALKIEITGHTDNIGNPADNLILSENRAKSVVKYLIANGIAPGRLMSKGYGETRPIAPNNSEENRAQNRRTELKVLGH